MAKILLLREQTQIGNDINNQVCFYDALNKELNNNGNDIMCLNTIQEIYLRKSSTKKWINSWIDKIKTFNPDIIFTFNNRIFQEIINVTDCPIVLFEADLADFFVNIEFIKNYKERYYMVTFSEKYIDTYKQLGFDDERIILLHPATSVQSENAEKKNNISFIGSCFGGIDFKIKEYMLSQGNSAACYEMYKEYWNSNSHNYKELLAKYFPNNNFSVSDYYKIFDNRVIVLQSILDLGLKLYGVNWNNLPSIYLPLISAYDSTPMYSLKHNQDIYNSSVINLSISHPQCEGHSFPWRIYDIMASNGVLVSSYADQLNELTKNYVQIPMYENPYDARELCKKMLKEDNLRNDIIAASNEFIDKFGRWQDNLEKIQSFTNVKIIDTSDNVGTSDCIKYDLVKEKCENSTLSRFKTITYGLLYSSCRLPLIQECISKASRYKIYRSMIKYNKELEETFKEIF